MAADVVQRIFTMSVEGKGPFQIAQTLTQEKVETPGVYQARLGVETRKTAVVKYPRRWSGTTVSNILGKPGRLSTKFTCRSVKKIYGIRCGSGSNTCLQPIGSLYFAILIMAIFCNLIFKIAEFIAVCPLGHWVKFHVSIDFGKIRFHNVDEQK